jgi:molybdate-binding protein/DNA-binding transcriptional regulator YhcF (GntR family)
VTEGPHLYRQIADNFRQEIMSGKWKPGDRLPSVRHTAEIWNCTVGTAQRAFQELARQGLVVSRPGQGTRVVEKLPVRDDTPLRRAMLVHRAETFLLEVLTGGHTLDEVEGAVRQAMDRWRAVEQQPSIRSENVIRFEGSHDPALTFLAGEFPKAAPGFSLQLRFSGSLGGLIALAEGKAELAGCHLWDEESNTYNDPFVRRLLPNKRVALVTLAQRRLGLIVSSGNPGEVSNMADLAKPGLSFANRQAGSGSRVFLDANLRRHGIDTAEIRGYEVEMNTHSAVAQAVAEGRADAGIGLEAAALSFGLDFVPLAVECYDFVIPAQVMEWEPVGKLVDWLKTSAVREGIGELGGYDASKTGEVRWVS